MMGICIVLYSIQETKVTKAGRQAGRQTGRQRRQLVRKRLVRERRRFSKSTIVGADRRRKQGREFHDISMRGKSISKRRFAATLRGVWIGKRARRIATITTTSRSGRGSTDIGISIVGFLRDIVNR